MLIGTQRVLLLVAMALVAAPASAAFVGTDFVMTIEGHDREPPHPNVPGFGPGYDVYLTNVSDETAYFGTNIWDQGVGDLSVTLNGEDIFESEHFLSYFGPFGPYPSFASVAPGETVHYGGFAVTLDFFTLPSVSTVVVENLVLALRNNDQPGLDVFFVEYTGDPVVNTLVTPVPAVGYSLLPVLLLVRRLLR